MTNASFPKAIVLKTAGINKDSQLGGGVLYQIFTPTEWSPIRRLPLISGILNSFSVGQPGHSP